MAIFLTIDPSRGSAAQDFLCLHVGAALSFPWKYSLQGAAVNSLLSFVGDIYGEILLKKKASFADRGPWNTAPEYHKLRWKGATWTQPPKLPVRFLARGLS